MEVSPEGVTIGDQMYQWGEAVVTGIYERVVYLKPDRDPDRVLLGEVAEYVINHVLAAARVADLELFENEEALKRILYDGETGHYTGLDISELHRLTNKYQYRSIVITSSQGITIEGIILQKPSGLHVTLHKIARIDDGIEVNPGYIRVTFTGADSYDAIIGKILSAGMILHGEAVDIQSVLFQDMTVEEIIREYYVLIGMELESLEINETDGTFLVNGEVKDLEAALQLARHYIADCYLGEHFHEFPSRLRFIRRSHPKVL